MKKVLLILCLAIASIQQALAFPPEIGIATYYGDNFHGRKTTNEEIYDKDQLTAAHKTLPYGTIVRVTVLATGATVDVRINDRGPFVKGRVITVSRKAAETLGILKETDPQVKLEVVQKVEPDPVPELSPEEKAAQAKANEEKAIADKKAAEEATKQALADKKAAEDAAKKAKAAEEKAIADKKALEAKSQDKKAADEAKKAKAAEEKAIADKKAADDAAKKAKTDPKAVAAKPTDKTTATTEPIAAKGNTKSAKTELKPSPAATAKEEPAVNFVKEAGKMKQGSLYKMQVLQMEEKGFGVQVAAYSDYESVFDQLAVLQENHFKGGLVYVDELNGKNYYKVIIGPFFTREEAVSYCNSLRKKHNMKDAFVVDLEKLNAKAQAVSVAPGTAAATAPVTPDNAPKTSAKVVAPKSTAPAKKGGK